MRDPIRVIEAAYELDRADENAWLASVAEAARAECGFDEGVLAYTFDVRDDGWVAPRAIVPSGLEPEIARDLFDLGPVSFEQTWAFARTHSTIGASHASKLGGGLPRRDARLREYFDKVLRARGFEDALTVAATDPTRHGCMLFAPVRRASKLVPAVATRYARIASHIAAGRRLHAAVASLTTEAVVDPRGKVVHATSDAAKPKALSALRAAAKAIDRARGSLRKRRSEEAMTIWRGLVTGQWSLVDRFESDGRRYLVAYRNEPHAPDPRSLTPRERQVVGFATLGQSNKLIAYHLGISPSTVGVLLGRAAAKLGKRSRAALVDAFVPTMPKEQQG